MTQLDQLSSEEIAARLSGSPEGRAALLREGAEAGLAEAQAIYGQMLLDGTGVERNPAEAFGWFWKAAQQGHVMGLNMLGRCYDLGWGTRWTRCARRNASASLPRAGSIGACTITGPPGAGRRFDPGQGRRARPGFEKAAAMGHAKSRNFVGSFHEDGELLPRDMARRRTAMPRRPKAGISAACSTMPGCAPKPAT
jgi:TPR repeat protein